MKANAQAVIEALSDGEWHTTDWIADQAGLTRAAAGITLSSLCRSQRVERMGLPEPFPPLWALTPHTYIEQTLEAQWSSDD